MSCIELHLLRGIATIWVSGIDRSNVTLRTDNQDDDDRHFFRLEDLIEIKEGIYTDIVISYYNPNRGEQHMLPMERTMRLSLLKWLTTVNQRDTAFDCFSFANALHGEQFERPTDHSFTLHGPGTGSVSKESTSRSAKTGEMVFLFDGKTNKVKHFALCISEEHDLYLFKYGSGGPIYATSENFLLRLYECDLCTPVVQICHHCECGISSDAVMTVYCK